MADINARIYWQPGMELTANTFKELANNLYTKQKIANCIANNNRIGILPDEKFDCTGNFVKNVLEIPHFRCLALLPSGQIIDAEEDVSVKIPILYGNKYYLTVGVGKEKITFDKKEVTLMRPQYVYGIHTLEEVEQSDLMPVMKFIVADGRFSINKNYIPPCLLINANEQFGNYVKQYTETLDSISSHANLEEGEAKRCILHYKFVLESYDPRHSTCELMQFLQEIAHALEYHIVRPNSENKPEIPSYTPYDAEEWLNWFDNYLKGMVTILDNVVLEDHSIDYEQLKEDLRKEIYDRVYPELYEQIKKEILERFNPDMEKQIKEALTNYVDQDLRQQLDESLTEKLDKSLQEQLYPRLYDTLYDALYVPVEEEEEKEYIPQI